MAPVANRYDAVIIGGGHNGLTAAAYLARAGRKVLVLERRHVLGGAAVTEEVFPGFRFSEFSYVVSLLRPEIIRELELPKHGLEILPLDGTITPLDDDYLWRVNDHGKTIRELRRWSKSDAEAYEEYGLLMADMARFIKPILSVVPPDPGAFDPCDWLPLVGLAKTFRDLPERLQSTFVQLMTMSATDFLQQWFETDPLIATMSASGIIGTFQGVRSPGTAYVLLHHYMGEIDGAFRAWGIPRGGTGAISDAIASAARAAGVEIRTEAPVARIDVRNGRAKGVVLESGEEIGAGTVLSSVDSHVTFLGLVDPAHLEPSFLEEVRRYKFRGSSGQGEPRARRPARARVQARARASGSAARSASRRAWTTWSGRTTTRSTDGPRAAPYIDMHHPHARRSVDGAARQARDVVLRAVRAVPPLGRANVGRRRARRVRRDRDRRRIEERFPNIRNLILHQQVLTPLDIERITGLTEGNIFQGELSLEQLFFNRPVPGWARYRTPIKDLWMCGSATHPGGGIMGAPGRIAALELLGGKAGSSAGRVA